MKKLTALTSALMCIIMLGGCARQEEESASFGQWATELDRQQLQWVQAEPGDGEPSTSYLFPEQELDQVVTILKTITDNQISRGQLTEDIAFRLIVVYQDILWQFQCTDSGTICVTFSDADTAACYGCIGEQLLIDNPELWEFIRDTVETSCEVS